MFKTCINCQQNFEITDEDLKFYEKVSPEFGGKKYLIPAPTMCPDCRQQRRLCFRNERNLYKRKCDLCKKEVVSVYSTQDFYQIYCKQCWWSDQLDVIEYGIDFDFNKSFFEQYKLLQNSLPKLALMIDDRSENADYCPYLISGKNCYLCVSGAYTEDCYYCYFLQNTKEKHSKDCVDCACSRYCELSYECLDCVNCYNLFYSQNCKECVGSWFLYNCYNCKNCFCCTNLVNKEYCIFNQQYGKNEYLEKLKNFKNSYTQIKEMQEKFQKNKIQSINKSYEGKNNENSIGNFINNSKNAFYCYDVENIEDSSYLSNVVKAKDCYDGEYFLDSELCYETISTPGGYGCSFSEFVWNSNNIKYSSYCFYSENLFGCVGLHHKKYCILNQQYTKEEYEELVPRIIEHMIKIGEWGEFFPSSISPFGYNETVAQEYFPLTRDEIAVGNRHACSLQRFRWSDFEPEFSKVEKIILANLLPESITNIPDDILNWAVECEITKKTFRIIKPELDFYREMNLPIPRRCPDQRHKDRMALRNPRKLFDRNCMKCETAIKTTYSPDRPEIVYCEKCYLESVY